MKTLNLCPHPLMLVQKFLRIIWFEIIEKVMVYTFQMVFFLITNHLCAVKLLLRARLPWQQLKLSLVYKINYF